MPHFFDFRNFSGRYPMPMGTQTVVDKDNIIADAQKTIAAMRKRLQTEEDPKVRARCEEIIKNQQETIDRERKAKEIISRNPFGPLCSLKPRQH